MKDPVRFSTTFNIDKAFLRRMRAFDPILNADTRLFIDPLLLETSRTPEMREGHRAWIEHFSNIVTLLAAARGENHIAWRAADRAFKFPEIAGTCLGYGAGIRGSGIGAKLRARMLTTAKQIVDLGVDNPELFVLVPLLEKDIASDRISDMTTGIISRHLAAFTRRVIGGYNVPLEDFQIAGEKIPLPRNPLATIRTPVLLVSTDVLRDLPIASEWEDVAQVTAANDAYRQRINKSIGDIWRSKVRLQKDVLRKNALSSAEAIRSLLDAVTAAVKKPYDIDTDREGLVHWLEDAARVVLNNPLSIPAPRRKTPQELNRIVRAIIAQFRRLVEVNGLWRLFYWNKKPRHERYPQLLFYAISACYCQGLDIDISPESNAGGGPVDFKFSDGYATKVVVEIKYSNNSHLYHGYSTQLETYKIAENTDLGYLLVLDVGRGDKQVERTQELEEVARKRGERHSIVELVDARRKQSASKRRGN